MTLILISPTLSTTYGIVRDAHDLEVLEFLRHFTGQSLQVTTSVFLIAYPTTYGLSKK